ncbi:hypothetical protein ASPZODRAFT_1892294 [Penicilliopsis zonata CBS 506.65]|uniref:DUF7703 domain-containing protein n=1 Tax=Penicilliopsis zonata CBS 506.65 TaxID=1073090 RepID=A0A1L9SIZ9_9EURO|nr:hypothetical protein ASPZODRAFT_1892294 [Penicilliopsis zonata CBS 506.65]OJJ47081.1 hypothetical protein ASPZODRAFT_1892294 [Penicilliopsis zonata CBS 506.65]
MSSTQDPLDGISGELAHDGDVMKIVLIVFISISWYNVTELVVLVLSTFRRWRGLYFWCLLLSGCLGVGLYSLGFMLKFFTQANSTFSVTVLTVGWWAMVTGQSVVLYSRLHLVLRDEGILRRVLIMIIVDFFLLHVPTTILTYGSNVKNRSGLFVEGYNIMEKIQMTGFTIQEAIISALYVSETVKLLRLGSDHTKRRIMYQLVGINVAMFVMDLVLLGLEYASYYAVQITLKGVIYSVKLKLEFAVLGRLVDVVHGDRQSGALGNSLRLASFPYSSDQAPGAPLNTLPVPTFYSAPVTDMDTPDSRLNHEDQMDESDGKMLTMRHFSTWVED